MALPQRVRKFKKVEAKNSWNQINQLREIAFLAVLNFFPVQKLIFGRFYNGKKWILIKKIREIDLFDSTSFLAWTFFNFLAHCGLSEENSIFFLKEQMQT